MVRPTATPAVAPSASTLVFTEEQMKFIFHYSMIMQVKCAKLTKFFNWYFDTSLSEEMIARVVCGLWYALRERMVYYFTSNVVSPSAFLYVGKDKVENEELIKYGLEEDFHADKLSSAHIYLRLNEGESWENIPSELLDDCSQLTKANSIEGNKKDNVTVIYTPWSNLHKDGSMAVGQVGFADPKKVKRVLVKQRENPIVNRLNKTKVEKYPDLRQEREDRLRQVRKREQAVRQDRKKEEARIAKERKEKAWQKDHAYDDLFTEENLAHSSNQDRDADFLDDFM
ncbi:MAG: hypothetical protein M1815_003670 [Lichina confinis]|nr:MAG: hypothetical protein M1815_003670 [Lichina confinis]